VPSQPGSATVPAYFLRFLAYKNSGRGVWLRGRDHYLSDAVLADNQIGATFASAASDGCGCIAQRWTDFIDL